METSKELKYILAYMSKSMGFTDPMEFVFNQEQQFIFESILFSGLTLYNNGGASKAKLAESHKRFVQDIEHKNELLAAKDETIEAYKLMKKLLDSEGEVSNAIGRLTDKKYFYIKTSYKQKTYNTHYNNSSCTKIRL